MAKVNTRSANKLAGVRIDLPDEITNYGSVWRNRVRYVLRSDGKVLASYQTAIHYEGQPDYWGSQNYRTLGTIKDLGTFNLEVWARRRHPNAVTVTVDK